VVTNRQFTRFGIAMNLITKDVLRFASVGFAVGVVLCAYAFYLTSHGRVGNTALFLALCPPSFGAIALDNTGLAGALVGWFFICIANAVFYGLIGLGVGDKLQRRRN
jgi:hypothetical protein